MSWARLLKRVFNIDLEHCPHCDGTLTIIAAILDPTVIAKILAHLGLSIQRTAPFPRAPTRSLPRRLTPHQQRFCHSAKLPLGLRSRKPPIWSES